MKDTGNDALVQAFIDAAASAPAQPEMPKAPQPFDYSLRAAMQRARDGSVLDARMILALIGAMLRKRLPLAGRPAMLSGEVADYLADTLDAIGHGADPANAFGLERGPGSNPYDNARRDHLIAYIAELFKAEGRRDFIKATANQLADWGWQPPRGSDAWTDRAVRAAISAHKSRDA